MPLATTELSISRLLVNFDEEVLKDLQYLMKLWSWHATAIEKDLSYFRYRPSYETPVAGNARAFWQYAIKATIYKNRRNRVANVAQLARKRQRQMVELSQAYKLMRFNDWVLATLPQKVHDDALKLNVGDRNFDSIEQMRAHIVKLERKLAPEQSVVAHTKAEKDSELLIQEESAKHGWGSWLKSMVGYG